MKEFGSDFHYISSYNSGRAHLTDVFGKALLLADGRQCIVSLIRDNGWKRIWIPEYFCYDVIETVRQQTSVEVFFYKDNPLAEGQPESLPFKHGDVLLRMNYFGMREKRSNVGIPIPVIEDHSHDPLGHWALYSDADWCISSLRKSLPLAEGGMMWSPKGLRLKEELLKSTENDKIAEIRWDGMQMKADYLIGGDINKSDFRKKYVDTEEWFEHAEPTLIDDRGRVFVSDQLDINLWIGAKRRNWEMLMELVDSHKSEIIVPEHESCTMFSFILLLSDRVQRDKVRVFLIKHFVYPAILWNVPETTSEGARNFSERMLSIHCDGRYNEDDIKQLACILNKSLEVR